MTSARKKHKVVRPKILFDKSPQTLKRKSFTLIEIMIVIAILAIIATLVVVAINPTKRFGQARDAQRKQDLGALKNALEEYLVDHGSYPSTGGINNWQGDSNDC